MKNKACENLSASVLIQCESDGDEIKARYFCAFAVFGASLLFYKKNKIKKTLHNALTVIEISMENFENTTELH